MKFNPLSLLQALPVALDIVRELKGVPKERRKAARGRIKEKTKEVCENEKCKKY